MYKVTTITDVCNAGANVTVKKFDSMYEVQDYIEEETRELNDDDKELFYSYTVIVGEES